MAAEKNKNPKKQSSKGQSKAFYNLFVALLLGLSLFNFYMIFDEYSTIGKASYDEGRKVIYDVNSSKLKAAENKPEVKPGQNTAFPNNTVDEEGKNNAKGLDDSSDIIEDPNATQTAGDKNSKVIKSGNLGIIIVNLGLKQSNYDIAKNFPPQVTFSFSPYSREIQNKVRLAKAEGRDVMVNLEAESNEYPLKDTGPYTIHSFFDAPQNIYRLQTTLSLADNFIGALVVDDEVITDKRDTIMPIMEFLAKRKLFLAYVKNPKNSSLENDVKPISANILQIDYFINENMNSTELAKKLEEIRIELLKGNKKVMAIEPVANHLNELKSWVDSNMDKDVRLIPASQLVSKN